MILSESSSGNRINVKSELLFVGIVIVRILSPVSLMSNGFDSNGSIYYYLVHWVEQRKWRYSNEYLDNTRKYGPKNSSFMNNPLQD